MVSVLVQKSTSWLTWLVATLCSRSGINYGLISIISLFIDQVVSNFIFYVTSLSPIFSTILGYSSGLLLHYFLSSRYVFSISKKASGLSVYIVTGSIGFFLHGWMAYFFVGMLAFEFSYIKIVSAIISFLVVYWSRVLIYGLKDV